MKNVAIEMKNAYIRSLRKVKKLGISNIRMIKIRKLLRDFDKKHNILFY